LLYSAWLAFHFVLQFKQNNLNLFFKKWRDVRKTLKEYVGVLFEVSTKEDFCIRISIDSLIIQK
jgi:hypothetical protein